MFNPTSLKKIIPQSTLIAFTFILSAVAIPAQATTFTRTPPTSAGALPTGVSEIGGVVLDLIGINGTRVVSQLSAEDLFVGITSFETQTTTIGTQTGFDPSILNALGGGLKEVAVRFSLFDGDTSTAGVWSNGNPEEDSYEEFDNFDLNENFLLLNGLNFGNWSAVNAQHTDSQGNTGQYGFSDGGFRDWVLDTGWFYTADAGLLNNFYNSLVQQGKVTYELYDIDTGDQYLDFKKGIADDLTSVDKAPTIVPPQEDPTAVPEPASVLGLVALGAFGMGSAVKRKQQQQV